MIEYKSGEELSFMKKSPHSPECVSSILVKEKHMEVVKGRGYVYSIQYHIVWCVKYRRNILNGQVAIKLKELLTQISEDNGFQILEMNMEEDHS